MAYNSNNTESLKDRSVYVEQRLIDELAFNDTREYCDSHSAKVFEKGKLSPAAEAFTEGWMARQKDVNNALNEIQTEIKRVEGIYEDQLTRPTENKDIVTYLCILRTTYQAIRLILLRGK